MTRACTGGMGIFRATTGPSDELLFEVIVPLVCEGRREAFVGIECPRRTAPVGTSDSESHSDLVGFLGQVMRLVL